MLSREVLALVHEDEPDPERVNGIFRAAHSLKGLAAMFGVEPLAHLAHRAEDALDALRLGRVPLQAPLLECLVEVLDVLQAQLADAAAGEEREETRNRAEELEARLTTLAAAGGRRATDVLDLVGLEGAVRAVLTEYEEHRLRENVSRGVALWRVRAAFGLDDFDQRLAELGARLKPLGEVVSTLPSSRPGDAATIAFDLLLASGRARAELEDATFGLATLEPLPGAGPFPRATPRGPDAASPSGLWAVGGAESSPSGLRAAGEGVSLRSLTQTVRVDIGRLDALMNSVGELLLIRSTIERLAEVARGFGPAALPKGWPQELQRETRALERRLDELQKGVLAVRMVPLGQVFDRLARLMRRLVRESGKDVAFDVAGGDVELDKLIVEELSDPLMHLLRNALDHGVERPAARVQAGKPARGTVRLRARQQGNHVVIEVGDDGAGIDEARVREVAVARGLASREATLALDRAGLLNLVFLPGFSTRPDVSELSGRGVGLDVVKTNLARLSGLIDLASTPGVGTTFTLTLPLTLAIIRALMVRTAGRTYALPLNSVQEIASVRERELTLVDRRETFEVRGQRVPFVRLARLFGLPEVERPQHFVVLVGLGAQRVGLAVDELGGQQDIVTKPLGGRLQSVRGIAGATELGDRRAVLVLDVAMLLEELVRARAAG